MNKAYAMTGLIKRNFIHMDPRTFVIIYKATVRHLSMQTEFGPLKGDIELRSYWENSKESK